MGTLGIDGLASGLDTTSLINSLMKAEAMPQTFLKQKSSATQTLVTALQTLNTKVAALTEAATTAAKPASWQTMRATASSPTVTATSGATAQPAELTFTVDQVARSQVSLTAPVVQGTVLVPEIPPSVTVGRGDGTFLTVHPSTGSLEDVAKAINQAADAGVRATVVRVGADEAGTPQYRLQFTGASTGATQRFAVYAGTVADADLPSATRLDTTTTRTAQDAAISLVGLPDRLTSPTNTFTGLVTGVDVTVSAVTGPDDEPVTLTVARDGDAVKKLASDMVSALSGALAEITTRTRSTTKTAADGTTTVTGGIFSADTAIRDVQRRLVDSATGAVGGQSPTSVGIVIQKDGTVTFDEAKFTAALAADPAKVQSMVTAIAGRVAETGKALSDKYDGSLSKKIQGQERLVSDYGRQIDSWDRRLELRRETLQRTYSALEVTLSNMQGQSSWLAGQLAALPRASA